MKDKAADGLMMEECAEQIRAGDFLHDFEVFLRYVENEKIKLTPKLQLIPLKHAKNIASLFRQPDQAELKVGDRVFKARYEYQLARFYFIDLLAVASGCTKVTSKGYYKKGENLADFREAELFQKIGVLFLNWWDYFDWDVYFPYGNDFAECLQDTRVFIVPILKKTINMHKVDVEQFTDEVIAATGVKWKCEASDPDNSMAKWGVERTILQAMSYFGAVELVKKKKGKYGLKKTVAFSLTEPLGKWLVSILPPGGLTISGS
jgi:hypothetical protein